jgi:DNA replication and repair protein RecF
VDAGVFHVEPSYLAHWREFRRVLSQRNAALKSGRLGELQVWNEPLVRSAAAVDGQRSDYAAGLAEVFSAVGRRLLGLDVSLRYLPGWRQGAGFAEALAASLERDRITGTTQVGPHRGDIEVRFTGGAVRELASRGQQKLVAAALVLSQVAEFERRTGRQGTLLVDDPAAELDDQALERLLGEIDGLRAQRIVTGLRLAAFDVTAGEPVFHVEQGIIKPVVY